MICLAIDTTTDTSGIALADESKVLAEYIFANHRDLSMRLLPNIKTMLKDCKLSMADLGAIGISTGPGSFTGIRIGVVTTKTLAQALDIPIGGVTSIDLLAMPFSHIPDTLICPLIKVRKGEAYYAIFETSADGIKRISEYGSGTISDIASEITKLSDKKIIFCGDAVSANAESIIEAMNDRAIITTELYAYPRASILALEAIKMINEGKGSDAYSLLPFYIRKSTPEMKLEDSCKH